MHQGHFKFFRMAMTKHECLWMFQLWFKVVVDKLNGYTKYPKSCVYMHIGRWFYNVDLEITLQTMLYVLRDDKHKMKIEKKILSIFFQTTLRLLESYLHFLNSKKKKNCFTPKLFKFLKFFFLQGKCCAIYYCTLWTRDRTYCVWWLRMSWVWSRLVWLPSWLHRSS